MRYISHILLAIAFIASIDVANADTYITVRQRHRHIHRHQHTHVHVHAGPSRGIFGGTGYVPFGSRSQSSVQVRTYRSSGCPGGVCP